jgi:hypothetical protein
MSVFRVTVPCIFEKKESCMNVASRLALGLVLAGTLTCVAISAPQVGAPRNVFYDPFQGPFNAPQESAQLSKQYVDSKKEDERREIRKKLTDVLTQQFDQQIQEQLEDLDKQITSLRAVLKKRLDAKSAIVERRIEQLIQDAEGLGWNAPGSPHGPAAGAFAPGYRIGFPQSTPSSAAKPKN